MFSSDSVPLISAGALGQGKSQLTAVSLSFITSVTSSNLHPSIQHSCLRSLPSQSLVLRTKDFASDGLMTSLSCLAAQQNENVRFFNNIQGSVTQWLARSICMRLFLPQSPCPLQAEFFVFAFCYEDPNSSENMKWYKPFHWKVSGKTAISQIPLLLFQAK